MNKLKRVLGEFCHEGDSNGELLRLNGVATSCSGLRDSQDGVSQTG